MKLPNCKVAELVAMKFERLMAPDLWTNQMRVSKGIPHYIIVFSLHIQTVCHNNGTAFSSNKMLHIFDKLLIQNCYHSLIYIYMPNKQNCTTKVLPPLVVPISDLAHGLLEERRTGDDYDWV